ncbi:MAG: prephenate dehydrogenase [Polyangia bacterium]
MTTFARAALVGCGMVGGSLMAALRAAGVVGRVIGFDRDATHAEAARARGLVDEVAADAAAAVRGCELVLLAVPVGATGDVCRAIAGAVADARLVTDVGSTKSDVVAAAEAALPDAARFCGAHPMAGTEKSGPAAADAALFAGKLALITPGARTSPEAQAACEALWRAAGARTRTMTPAAHDRAMAWVSHLPHAAAFALAAAVGGVAGEVAGLSGGGFLDTTRIAASDAAMWRDIFVANRAALLEALDAFGGELAALRRAVAGGDAAAIEALVARARDGRARVMR